MALTFYQILQVTQGASPAVLRAAYKTLAQEHHPDRNPEKREECERLMKIINEAYAVLRDGEKRRAYDSTLTEVSISTAAPGNPSNAVLRCMDCQLPATFSYAGRPYCSGHLREHQLRPYRKPRRRL
jgi:DnaJ-class molecular chaperone